MALLSDMRTLTQNLLDSYEARMEAVADLRRWARTTLKEMADEQDKKLAKQRQDLTSETTAMRQEMVASHQEMAKEQAQALEAYMHDLRHKVEKLLKDMDASHQSMATEQRKDLAMAYNLLAGTVAGMRLTYQTEQQAIQADQSAARQQWQALSALKMRSQPASKPVAAAPKKPAAKKSRSKKAQ